MTPRPTNQQPKERSISNVVNGTRIRFLRRRRGWTQELFAKLSGYSPRLIRKAESSQALNFQTIDVLAQTLSCPDFPVTYNDLITDPEQTAKRMVEAYTRKELQDQSKVEQIVVPDVRLMVAGKDAGLHLVGSFNGQHEFCLFWRQYFEYFRRPDPGRFQPLICSQMNHVIVSGDETLQSHSDTIPFSTWLIFRLRIDNERITQCDILSARLDS